MNLCHQGDYALLLMFVAGLLDNYSAVSSMSVCIGFAKTHMESFDWFDLSIFCHHYLS
jgi:hypothetical protein